MDGTTGKTGVGVSRRSFWPFKAGRLIGYPTRDFHPGPELSEAPHRGRRYECSLSCLQPSFSRSPSAPRPAELSPSLPSGKEAVAPRPPRPLNLDFAWRPRENPLPPSPAGGILWLWQRRNGLIAPSGRIKARPPERPPPGAAVSLTGGVQIRRIWTVEKLRPSPRSFSR